MGEVCTSVLFINFGKKLYHAKGHLKRSRMAQVTALKQFSMLSKKASNNDLKFDQNA